MEKILAIQPKGFILSGGPRSVYEEERRIFRTISSNRLTDLGICYGMQALTHALGGQVDPSAQREYGHAEIQSLVSSPLVSSLSTVWMSHSDRITQLPDGFIPWPRGNSPFAAMGDLDRSILASSSIPEVHHTPNGRNCSGISPWISAVSN